jgi:hypothetical protein
MELIIRSASAGRNESSALRQIAIARFPGLPDGNFFKPKIPFWVNLGASCNGRCWYIFCPFGVPILRQFDLFLWSFGTIYVHSVYFPVLVCCSKKNLATLAFSRNGRSAAKIFAARGPHFIHSLAFQTR